MIFDEYGYLIGTWALPAIENDDRSGLDDIDEAVLNDFTATLPPGGHWVWGESEVFAWDDVSGIPGQCVRAVYMVPVRAAA